MKKTLIALLAMLLVGVVAFYAGAASEEESDGLDQMVADGLLELQVKSLLLKDLGWDATTIDVAADSGDVTLSGKVDERSTQELAEEVAKSLEGVRSVHNHIKIEKPDDDEADDTPVADAVANAENEVRDAVLETRVKTKLLGELGRHGFSIGVEATDGVVSLRGEVPDEKRRDIALQTARGCQGVDKVVDLLKTKGS